MHPVGLLEKVVTIRKCQFLPSKTIDIPRAFCLGCMVTREIHSILNYVLMFTGPDSLTPNTQYSNVDRQDINNTHYIHSE
jgi:hypothetical protein